MIFKVEMFSLKEEEEEEEEKLEHNRSVKIFPLAMLNVGHGYERERMNIHNLAFLLFFISENT